MSGQEPWTDNALKSFERDYGYVTDRGLKLAAVDDPVRFVVLGDSGFNEHLSWTTAPYPDYCSIGCTCRTYEMCVVDEGCDVERCLATIDMVLDPDAGLRGRHLDGVNLGFLDGHAAWYSSRALRNMAPRNKLTPTECPDSPLSLTETDLDGLIVDAPPSLADGRHLTDIGFDCPGWP